MKGIILAGGRGTRLGPLAAQISKALVSVGSRPQVINQCFALERAGCEDIVVVTSPETHRQVGDVIRRAGLHNVGLAVQATPAGPVDALLTGLNELPRDGEKGLVVLMSDTVINEEFGTEDEWVGVGRTPDVARSWCFYDANVLKYVDGIPGPDDRVTIGIYHFNDIDKVHAAASTALWAGRSRQDIEIGMAPFLNAYGTRMQYFFNTWQDVGDVLALGRARRDKFIARAHHTLTLNDDGTITKSGVSTDELAYMATLYGARGRVSLFPQVYDFTDDSYTMQYVDLPSLAELWLYWPGRPNTWAGIVQSVVDRVQRDLWTTETTSEPELVWEFYVGKALARIRKWDASLLTPILTDRIEKAGDIIGDDLWVNGHGDLNFNNILYSLNTNACTLIDPRGGIVPQSYEYAKLAYSPIFSAITHDLFAGVNHILPYRPAEIEAVWSVLRTYISDRRLSAAVALTLLAACPMHDDRQAKAMFFVANDMLMDL